MRFEITLEIFVRRNPIQRLCNSRYDHKILAASVFNELRSAKSGSRMLGISPQVGRSSLKKLTIDGSASAQVVDPEGLGSIQPLASFLRRELAEYGGRMKSFKSTFILTLVLMLLGHSGALGADGLDVNAKSILGELETGGSEHSSRGPKSDKPMEPARSDTSELASEIKQVVITFEQARDTFVSQQKDLRAQLKGASEDQREKIREDLKKSQEQFVTQREQFRDQLKEASDKLRDSVKKLKDEAGAAKGTGKPRGG